MDKEEKLAKAKELQGKRDEFLDNIVFTFVSCGTPSNPADDDEINVWKNLIVRTVGFGVEEFSGKVKELYNEKDKDKLSELEKKINKLYDEYVYNKEDTSVPATICASSGVSVTLVVREGKEYRVMKLS